MFVGSRRVSMLFVRLGLGWGIEDGGGQEGAVGEGMTRCWARREGN